MAIYVNCILGGLGSTVQYFVGVSDDISRSAAHPLTERVHNVHLTNINVIMVSNLFIFPLITNQKTYGDKLKAI